MFRRLGLYFTVLGALAVVSAASAAYPAPFALQGGQGVLSNDGSIRFVAVGASPAAARAAGISVNRYLITTYINDPSIHARNQTLIAFAAYNAAPRTLKRFRTKAKDVGVRSSPLVRQSRECRGGDHRS